MSQRAYLESRVKELEAALKLMVRAYESLLPGLRHIAVQDYKLINDAPVAARNALGPSC